MEEKLKIFLDKIELDKDLYNSFLDSKLTKIKISSDKKKWTLFIDAPKPLELDIIKEIDSKKNLLDKNATEINIVYNLDILDKEVLLTYYPYILEQLKSKIKIVEKYIDLLKLEEDKLVLVVPTKIEMRTLEKLLPDINRLYKMYGYDEDIDIVLRKEDKTALEIAKSLEVDYEKYAKLGNKKLTIANKKKVPVNEKCIIGRTIRGESLPIKTLLGEDNDVIVTAKIFDTDFFESAKSEFKIITLKLTDYTDSIYCKIFMRDRSEFNRLKDELKKGQWYKIRGYTKNDAFAKELVLNARDVEITDSLDEEIVDEAKDKRIELHAHTKMSQMDGLCDEKELVKQAIAWGHKAIAITDHNSVQAFPNVYKFVTNHNKSLKDGEEPFKVIYGTELTLIDDNVDIALRPNKNNLLDETYVVFDFETTGFNAGGSDSIIEIGAVKIKNGEIIEKFDELINPGVKLAKKITELTGITDKMLKDKDDEQKVVKKFMDFYGDLPLVAHNAKFDVSFLEMALKKYDLGELTNPVIDTLELSRSIDSNYGRHSLSAIVKRYNVEFDEESHHRADYDALGTALVFHKMLKKLSNRNIETMDQLETIVSKEEIHKYGRSYHVNLLVKDKKGLKNLFRLVSLANTKYLYKTPRILRSEIEKYREGLLVGSGCYESEVFVNARSKTEEELADIVRFYDYVEVQPLECYSHLVESSEFANELELSEHLKKIIRVAEDGGKLVCATGDVHHIKREDRIFREIIVNQKVPGGGRHPLARYKIDKIPSNHFRTTEEMFKDFAFLDEKSRKRIIVDNPNKLADMVEMVEVIIDTHGVPFAPKIENSEKIVTDMVFDRATSLYGNPLPHNILLRISNELYGEYIIKVLEKKYKGKELDKQLYKVLTSGSSKVKEVIKKDLAKDESIKNVDRELNKRLGGVIGGNFDVIYLIAQKLVKHSNDEGYLVGSRGSVGSSFVATMMNITEVNPLPAHYLCHNEECKYSEFVDEKGNAYGLTYSSGYDLPNKKCPKCGKKMGKEGQDMPFATFLGFNADKVPDIDLNFSGENQASAHAYTKELFGVDNVYRAGTIGTVADKTAFGFVKGYLEEHGINDMRSAEIERLALGCTGVKRTTGQHPGGIVVIPDYMDVFDFTPYQYPADDIEAEWRTTHFDYHAIDEDVLKLDILGHDDPTVLRMLQDLSGIDVTKVPMDDKKVFSLLSSPKELGVSSEDILCPTGTLGLPEMGTKFVINMLEQTKPSTFAEVVKISGLSHGTDVWAGNASELIDKKIVPFKDVIGCRDDIMVSLMNWGVEPLTAFKIMEFVRRGKASKEKKKWNEYSQIMRDANIPDWYIDSCYKIKYMFPKAHAVAYVMNAIRIAWFKVYHPLYYYAAYFSIRVDDFDIETMIKGKDAIRQKLIDLQNKGYEATNKELNIIETLKIALEASCRGIKFKNIDLKKSEASRFIIDDEEENTLIPSFNTLDGLGGAVANSIVEERTKKEFLSVEDVQFRGKVSKTLIEKMIDMKILDDLPESNQLSLF